MSQHKPEILATEGEDFGQWFVPTTIGDTQKGSFLTIDGFPTKIMNHKKSKTGKHGHTKSHIAGICVLTGIKKDLVVPSDDTGYIPTVVKETYACQGFSEMSGDDTKGPKNKSKASYFILWNEKDMNQREDFPFRPDEVEVHAKIEKAYNQLEKEEQGHDSSDKELTVTMIRAPILQNDTTETFKLCEMIETFSVKSDKSRSN